VHGSTSRGVSGKDEKVVLFFLNRVFVIDIDLFSFVAAAGWSPNNNCQSGRWRRRNSRDVFLIARAVPSSLTRFQPVPTTKYTIWPIARPSVSSDILLYNVIISGAESYPIKLFCFWFSHILMHYIMLLWYCIDTFHHAKK